MQPTVTAQDFIDKIILVGVNHYGILRIQSVSLEKTTEAFNALLYRARQEARIEAIEECLAEAPEQKDKGDDEFATGYYKAFNDIHTYIARLKTK